MLVNNTAGTGATTSTSINQTPKRRRELMIPGVDQPSAPQVQPPGGDQSSPFQKPGPTNLPQTQPQQVAPATQPAATTPTGGMTFAQMQQRGFARPAPPQVPTPQPQYTASQGQYGGVGTAPTYSGSGSVIGSGGGGTSGPVNPRDSGDVRSATREQLLAMLQNPAGFGQTEVQQWYDRGAEDIDDEFSMQNTALREEMARRGLSDSSVMGGRLSDLNVQRRSAQVDLRDKLGRQLAEEMSRARDQAIGRGIEFDEFMTRSDLQGRELDLGYDKLSLDSQLGFGRLGVDQGRLDLDADLGWSERDLANRKFGEDQYQFDEDLGLRRDEFGEDRRQFDEDLGVRRDDLGLRRDEFGERRRQFDLGYELDSDKWDWTKDIDLMELFNNTDFLNPDSTPFYDE